MFPPIIGKNSVFMPLSQNEDALVDPSTVFISIERLCSPAAILVRAIQKVLEFLVRQRNQPNCSFVYVLNYLLCSFSLP